MEYYLPNSSVATKVGPAVNRELVALREPPFNYNAQEIIPRMGPELIRSSSQLDDRWRNLRELITKVEGGGPRPGAGQSDLTVISRS